MEEGVQLKDAQVYFESKEGKFRVQVDVCVLAMISIKALKRNGNGQYEGALIVVNSEDVTWYVAYLSEEEKHILLRRLVKSINKGDWTSDRENSR